MQIALFLCCRSWYDFPMEINVRSASVADAPRLREIYSYYVEKTAITYEYDVPSKAEFAQRIARTLEQYPYVCAECGGTVVGYAYASAFHPRAAYQWSAEVSIYVDSSFKSRGVGRALYDALELELKKLGFKNLYACIAVPSGRDDEYLTHASEKFHEHMGYTTVGRFSNCAKKFGRWYSMIWMEKIIGAHE